MDENCSGERQREMGEIPGEHCKRSSPKSRTPFTHRTYDSRLGCIDTTGQAELSEQVRVSLVSDRPRLAQEIWNGNANIFLLPIPPSMHQCGCRNGDIGPKCRYTFRSITPPKFWWKTA